LNIKILEFLLLAYWFLEQFSIKPANTIANHKVA
jgi:hypothetical protein